MQLLELKNVTFKYEETNRILLNNINLGLTSGEQIGIVGANGSGKSTITKILLGIYKLQNRNALVNLFGRKVSWNRHYPKLGYIGDPSYHPGWLGLPNNILVKDLIHNFKELWKNDLSSTKNDLFLNDLEERLFLKNIKNSNISLLSKGERLRLMAFMALGKRPQLLIADEATEGLDTQYKAAVLSIVKEEIKNSQLSMLWISHRYSEVIELTTKIYELTSGNLQQLNFEGFQFDLKTNENDNYDSEFNNGDKESILEQLALVLSDSKVSHFTLTVKKSIKKS
jgi:ABC-type multidrug transport system ATPase subunit